MHLVQTCFWPWKLWILKMWFKVIHFYVTKKLMHNIHDVRLKCNNRMIIIGYMINTKFRLANQHHMVPCVTCSAWKRTLLGHLSFLKLYIPTLNMTPFFLTKCPNYHVHEISNGNLCLWWCTCYICHNNQWHDSSQKVLHVLIAN
jgi:hypothetical protein